MGSQVVIAGSHLNKVIQQHGSGLLHLPIVPISHGFVGFPLDDLAPFLHSQPDAVRFQLMQLDSKVLQCRVEPHHTVNAFAFEAVIHA